MPVEMELRYAPSRPFRLGTRRSRAPKARVPAEAGASRPRKRPPSLDTWKQLETTDFVFTERAGQTPSKRYAEPMNNRQWLLEQRTRDEEWDEAVWFQQQVLKAVLKTMDKWARKAHSGDPDNAAWLGSYRAVQTRLDGESGADAYKRVKKWLKENKPKGATAEWLKWERAYFAMSNCGKEYIGWKASCCSDRTRPIAVPVGCNHRLCPLCSYQRSQRGRVRIKTMHDRLTHPVMVTLTVPNIAAATAGPDGEIQGGLRKHNFTRFRQDARKWIAQRTASDLVCKCGHGRNHHKQLGADGELKRTMLGCRGKGCDCQHWRPVCAGTSLQHEFLGGIYSLETTHNRKQKTWHIHAHVLADLNHSLPPKFIEEGGKKRLNKVEFYGQKVFAFTALKWRMEFDWLQLTGGKEEWGFRPKNDPPKKSYKAIAKWGWGWEIYWANFSRWVHEKRDHSTIRFKVKRGRKWVLRSDLSPAQLAEYRELEAWNAKNTRVFHIEPVDDRDGAAREVLKYITKVADFSDRPDAIEEFCNATRGARLVQTFGTWYGFAVDVEFDPNHFNDWGKRPDCVCGSNHWEKTGVYHYHDVERDETGRCFLKRSALKHDCGGTVAHPRIRAGDPQRENYESSESDQPKFSVEYRRNHWRGGHQLGGAKAPGEV